MMKKILFTLLSILLPVLAWCDDKPTMTVETSAVVAGSDFDLTVNLNNGDLVCNGFQFKIQLPTGITIAYDEEEEDYAYTLSDRYTKAKKMQVNIQQNSEGVYQLLCYSMSNETITGSEGPIITLHLNVDENMEGGDYEGYLKKVAISDINGNSIQIDDVIFTLSVTPKPVTVTVNSYSRFYGDENPIFEYSIEGAELEGTPEIYCEATVESPVGEYDIIVTAGTLEYPNLVLVNGILNVEKSPLTIRVGDYSIKQGDPLPDFILQFEGFKNDETAEVLTKQPEVTTEATSSSPLGTYPIKISGAEAQNYEFSYIDGSLTITEADPIMVTVGNYTRSYGEENPVFEINIEGGELKGTPEIICEATKESPVGIYDIIVSAGTVENFNVTYVSGKLNVEKAPLIISAGDYTIKQGDSLPEFIPKFDGFKNGETAEVLTKQPEFTTEATSSSPLGTYLVKVSGAEAQNYELSYVDGSITILEADAIIVRVNNCTRAYGDLNPTFEYTVEGGELIGEPLIYCDAYQVSPVGEYEIIAEQGSVENFNVTFVNGTLTVEKAILTVNCGLYTMKQGDPLPEFKPTYEGFKNSETAAVIGQLPVLSTEATSTSPVGTYPVKASGGEAYNYDFEYIDGILTITEADPVTVIVGNYTRKYGEENPVFEYYVEGGYLRGEPKITCEATKESPVGIYDIIISDGEVENFNVTYVNGTLTVEQAPLLVIADDCVRYQYDENPEFTISYEGFVNDDTEDVFKVKPTAYTEATADSAPGTYAIVVSGGEAENYSLTYKNGTLTVLNHDGIATVTIDHPANVYNLQGTIVRQQTTSLSDLPRGIYVVEGKKVAVK